MIQSSCYSKVDTILGSSRHFGGDSKISESHERLLAIAKKAIALQPLDNIICLWTVYTLQHQSCIFHFDSESHIIIDLAEIDPIKSLGLALLNEVETQTIADVFLRIFADEYFRRQEFVLALKCHHAFELGNPQRATLSRPSDKDITQHESRINIMDTFVICHELGHMYDKEGGFTKFQTENEVFDSMDWMEMLISYFEETNTEGMSAPKEYVEKLIDEARKLKKDSTFFREIESDLIGLWLVENVIKDNNKNFDEKLISEARFVFTSGMNIMRYIRMFSARDTISSIENFEKFQIMMEIREILLNQIHNTIGGIINRNTVIKYGEKLSNGLELALSIINKLDTNTFDIPQEKDTFEFGLQMMAKYGWSRVRKNIFWDYVANL